MGNDKLLGHLGKKIEHIRHLRGMNQDVLASKMNISQTQISRLEKSKIIDDDILKQLADALDVTVDTIKNFSEEAAICNIQNNYDNAEINSQIIYQYNPLEKLSEAYEDNKRLYEENNKLILQLLQTEKEKVALLEGKLSKVNNK